MLALSLLCLLSVPVCPCVCRPVPKHVHNAGSNGRFSTIQCRISHSELTSLLRDWSSFVLVEGYSYVKLIYRYRWLLGNVVKWRHLLREYMAGI